MRPVGRATPYQTIYLAFITLTEILALSLWSSGTAAGSSLLAEAQAPIPGLQAWLTSSVQAGFVAGTLLTAALASPTATTPAESSASPPFSPPP